MLRELAIGFAITPVIAGTYAYIGYPALLSLAARGARRPRVEPFTELPSLSVVIPVYNEERVLAETLEHVLALEYPRDRLQIVVVSDASSDRTDDIARAFAVRGVELLRVPARRGKTAAENAAGAVVRGDIVVNVDATVRLPHDALRTIVQAFADPTVGVASGRDVTIGSTATQADRGEGRYTGYEMRVRSLETRVHSIVGASGCFFASRRELYRLPFPEQLSRDFGSALVARVHSFRAVAVDDAVCFVPCTTSLRVERRRKVRTMTRGLGTLWYMRRLLNPARYGVFSWMLFSHKLARWSVTLTAPFALAGVGTLALLPDRGWIGAAARALAGATAAIAAFGWMGLALSERRRVSGAWALPAFAVAAISAGVQAWTQWLLGKQKPLWEPTRRAAAEAPTVSA